MLSEPFCSQLSRASALPLHGSATQAEVWVLLEHAGSWPAQWLEGNDLPETVQTWTRSQERTVPRSRVAFIKRDHSGPDRSLYIAVTDPATPRLYHFRWRDYSDLLAIDVAAVIAGEAQADLVDEILVAVCTHGRRDRCCAKFGLPVYRPSRASQVSLPGNALISAATGSPPTPSSSPRGSATATSRPRRSRSWPRPPAPTRSTC